MTDRTELLARLDMMARRMRNMNLNTDAEREESAAAAIRDLTAQLEAKDTELQQVLIASANVLKAERTARERVETLHKGLMQEQERRVEEAEAKLAEAAALNCGLENWLTIYKSRVKDKEAKLAAVEAEPSK